MSPEPSRSAPFCRVKPRSSATSFRLSRHAGRPRSKLSATITSVPPWIGQASRCSAFRRSASSSVRGVRTSTRAKGTVLGRSGRIPFTPAGGGPRRRAGRPRHPRRPGALRLHARVAGDGRRGRRRLRRRARRVRGPRGRSTRPAAGSFPAFIDAHMHLESSKLLVDEFARLVLPFGTTAVVADPHEIANVLGTDGVHWLLDVCDDLPLDVYFMASSCVPASHFESPRRELTPGDLDALLRRRRVIGLAEMMNFPGVIGGAPSELAKLALARARRRSCARRARPLAECLRGRRDPLRPRGVHARGGPRAAARRDVAADPRGDRRRATCTRCCRCSPSTARGGSRSAPTTASRSTSPTTATSTRWCATRSPSASRPRTRSSARRSTRRSGTASQDLGAVAPGYHADLLVLPDLERFVPDLVLKNGAPVAEIPAATCPTGCGTRCGSAPSARRCSASPGRAARRA